MQTKSWHNVLDRSTWAHGPWDDEPDKMQWQDVSTGLPCLIVRHQISGHLSGYVGVRPGHPLHGLRAHDGDPSTRERFNALVDEIDVHGGINCGMACDRWPDAEGGIAAGVCHEPSPGEPDDVWWLGFDCMHAWEDAWPTSDLPEYLERMGVVDQAALKQLRELQKLTERLGRGTYRDFAFVQNECTRLAAQLDAMENCSIQDNNVSPR